MGILKKKTWQRMATDKQYREEYAIAMLKRMIPFQTRAIRKKREWSQAQLAEAANVTQGVISRAEDPDYGNLTLTTIGKIAAGFDLAAIIRFVPFTDLLRYSESSTEREFADLRTFEQEESVSSQTKGGEGGQSLNIGPGPTPLESLEKGRQKNEKENGETAAELANWRIPPQQEMLAERLEEVG